MLVAMLVAILVATVVVIFVAPPVFRAHINMQTPYNNLKSMYEVLS